VDPMKNAHWWIGLPLVALTLAVGPHLAGADVVSPNPAPPAGPKNLQVLPKSSTKDQVKATMKAMSRDLGVECDFCHEVPDMASDKSPKKKTAREMMRMTEELNAKWIKKVAAKAEVTCVTCHRGHEKPDGKGGSTPASP
jgi:hypothetical protein